MTHLENIQNNFHIPENESMAPSEIEDSADSLDCNPSDTSFKVNKPTNPQFGLSWYDYNVPKHINPDLIPEWQNEIVPEDDCY